MPHVRIRSQRPEGRLVVRVMYDVGEYVDIRRALCMVRSTVVRHLKLRRRASVYDGAAGEVWVGNDVDSILLPVGVQQGALFVPVRGA